MKKLTNIKGITMIALVITIIVLLILAGVTVATLTGENGLLSKAQLAKERNLEAEQDEKDKLSSYEDEIDNYKTWERTGGEGTNVSYCTTPATTTSTASATNPCVVVENYRNGTEWYRVWSDGWIEQGGHATAGDTQSGAAINLPKQFSDTNYTLNCMMVGNYNLTACRQVHCASKSVDKFYATGIWVDPNSTGGSTYTFDWYACGY